MNSEDEFAWQLHDRATRGESLSEEEHQQLQAWYIRQDALEGEALSEPPGGLALAHLEGQISVTLDNIAELTRRIQRITAENQALRRENSTLKSQLVRSISA